MKRLALLIALPVLALPVAVNAIPILDQSHTPASPGSSSLIGGTVQQAQTFTVGISGMLAQLDVLGIGGGPGLMLDIRRTVGGLPDNSQVLQTVNVGAFASSGYTSIALNVDVIVGEMLAFVFYGDSGTLRGFAASDFDPYTGGGLWTFGNPPFGGGGWYPNGNSPSLNFDLAFRTFVDPTAVPEPSTLALFGLGLAGMGFAGRRKQA